LGAVAVTGVVSGEIFCAYFKPLFLAARNVVDSSYAAWYRDMVQVRGTSFRYMWNKKGCPVHAILKELRWLQLDLYSDVVQALVCEGC
jgi:hypothetical protein